ncbi:MAG: ATP-dependent sacrificial sulfur transferase LarE [Methanotrichaceae archaeon]|nr:ATP-dependent sacrificial sulfur transferase LarE [Methanotrichaceae archaeon]
MDCRQKLETLRRIIANNKKLLIAFSGGVDSSLLAKISSDMLGNDALCIILDHEAFPRSELSQAEHLAKSLGLNYRIVKFSLLDEDKISRNSKQRCYFCKKASAKVLKKLALDEDIVCVADGANLSDCNDYRPGLKACDEMGIWHPFVDAKISKEDVREISRELGLSSWDKPSSACLATRIPYYEGLNKEKLRMVEAAEDYLKGLGLSQVRVRNHCRLARIEVMPEEMEKALAHRKEIGMELKRLGFEYVSIDLEGFRSGSMNEVLWTSEQLEKTSRS